MPAPSWVPVVDGQTADIWLDFRTGGGGNYWANAVKTLADCIFDWNGNTPTFLTDPIIGGMYVGWPSGLGGPPVPTQVMLPFLQPDLLAIINALVGSTTGFTLMIGTINHIAADAPGAGNGNANIMQFGGPRNPTEPTPTVEDVIVPGYNNYGDGSTNIMVLGVEQFENSLFFSYKTPVGVPPPPPFNPAAPAQFQMSYNPVVPRITATLLCSGYQSPLQVLDLDSPFVPFEYCLLGGVANSLATPQPPHPQSTNSFPVGILQWFAVFGGSLSLPVPQAPPAIPIPGGMGFPPAAPSPPIPTGNTRRWLAGIRPSREIIVPNTYVAKAVALNGTQSLTIASLTCTDSFFFGCSFWFQSINESDEPTFFVSNPAGAYNNWTGFHSSNHNFWTELALDDESKKFEFFETSHPSDSNWHHVLIAANTDFAASSKQAKIYIDGVDVTTIQSDADIAFMAGFSGQAFALSDVLNGFGVVGNLADFWLGNTTNLLDGGGSVPLATRELFRDSSGKPMDPTGFPAGTVLFSGDASTFVVNQYPGNVFTVVGSFATASPGPSA